MIAYTYTILNVRNGKIYVGWTVNPQERWRKHQRNAKLKLRFHLYRALAIEPSNFEYSIMSIHYSETEAMSAEQYWISYFKSNDDQYGYNMTEGGEGCIRRGKDHHWFGKRGKLSHNWGRKQHQNTRDAIKKGNDKRRTNGLQIIELRKQQINDLLITSTRRWGIIANLSLLWGVSHTQVRRFIQIHMPNLNNQFGRKQFK